MAVCEGGGEGVGCADVGKLKGEEGAQQNRCLFS